jgi:hypothetical protein
MGAGQPEGSTTAMTSPKKCEHQAPYDRTERAALQAVGKQDLPGKGSPSLDLASLEERKAYQGWV